MDFSISAAAGEVVAKRVFDLSFVFFDVAFLVLFAGLLLWKKKYATVLVGFAAGILYLIVDYGVFYGAFKERTVYYNGATASPGVFFAVLLWMSLSYGFTNFSWIWLWLNKDRDLLEWSLLILLWWFAGPMLASKFCTGNAVVTFRGTETTHGGMAIVLLIGYSVLFVWNMSRKEGKHRVNIPWLLAIGILVQFGWEAGLLLGGIRSDGRTAEQKITTLIVNSLLETNLGMPYIYFLFILYSGRFTETLKERLSPMTFSERVAENNLEKVRGKRDLPSTDTAKDCGKI